MEIAISEAFTLIVTGERGCIQYMLLTVIYMFGCRLCMHYVN